MIQVNHLGRVSWIFLFSFHIRIICTLILHDLISSRGAKEEEGFLLKATIVAVCESFFIMNFVKRKFVEVLCKTLSEKYKIHNHDIQGFLSNILSRYIWKHLITNKYGNILR